MKTLKMDQMNPIDNENPLYSKCEKAKETGILDLKHSHLTDVPSAVFNLISPAELKECDLSFNILFDIPPQLALKFHLLIYLNISHNSLSMLPTELVNLQALETLNIAGNFFSTLPSVVFKLPQLTNFYAQGNLISSFNIKQPIESDRLDLVDLRYNPLNPDFRRLLRQINTTFRLLLSAGDAEDYDFEDDIDFDLL
ncbi:leucine-rich repeat protein SHOC-2-like isoform X1 [Drosophila obscura]|uniref:leucine-rich repeat protein SHOC-2-like isoform X1 n=2 Tax=Drosophila obscura TaxID=7282 RepID=UPI001BB2582E|nr:leucine-rich repeat protein SHOC-2-like isoform X1 [Drosophila obscura]